MVHTGGQYGVHSRLDLQEEWFAATGTVRTGTTGTGTVERIVIGAFDSAFFSRFTIATRLLLSDTI